MSPCSCLSGNICNCSVTNLQTKNGHTRSNSTFVQPRIMSLSIDSSRCLWRSVAEHVVMFSWHVVPSSRISISRIGTFLFNSSIQLISCLFDCFLNPYHKILWKGIAQITCDVKNLCIPTSCQVQSLTPSSCMKGNN